MRKTPVIMSAVLPGIGQFMQGRRLAGTLFLTMILIPFFAMIGFFVSIITDFYRLGFDIHSEPGNIRIRFAGMAVSFVVALIVFVINMVDTAKAEKTPPPVPQT